MSTKMGMPTKPAEYDKRFNEVEYFVEATDFEKFALWERNEKYKQDPTLTSIARWDQGTGVMVTIGHQGKRPICVAFFFDKLDGHTVCFHEATSELVDHKMVKDWLDENFPNIGKTNASNFHRVFDIFE